jgi:hypothetical protein
MDEYFLVLDFIRRPRFALFRDRIDAYQILACLAEDGWKEFFGGLLSS